MATWTRRGGLAICVLLVGACVYGYVIRERAPGPSFTLAGGEDERSFQVRACVEPSEVADSVTVEIDATAKTPGTPLGEHVQLFVETLSIYDENDTDEELATAEGASLVEGTSADAPGVEVLCADGVEVRFSRLDALATPVALEWEVAASSNSDDDALERAKLTVSIEEILP